ncbi:hypothetical protein BGZ80_007349 [Entomortierella chlamydospora]|uniref:Uncharacterized protein n=1 Tax=Entomortierella chlamydospora TaxID=101097 RepID=A0A9P6MZE8_9FUNG|nr:hypothetical protein BGZ80_007349 [Entomortierella chlamydospora]
MLSHTRTPFLSQFCRTRFSSRQPTLSSPLQRLAFIRFQSTQSQAIRDQSYPYPLYYHQLPQPSSSTTATSSSPDQPLSYAVSFLPTFPHHNYQIIGFLTHDKIGDLHATPNKFTENEAFNIVLHTVIQKNLDKDPVIQLLQPEGWTHIADYRNPAPHGRIPLPEDIFGSVQVIGGVIQPSTYQRMPTHRIVSRHGVFQLSEYLHEKLVNHLKTF